MGRGLLWSKWDTDTHLNEKLLACPPEARWLYFAVTQEMRRRGSKDGVVPRLTAIAIATEQKVSPDLIKWLVERPLGNPLWHQDGDDYVIHDYDRSAPPGLGTSTARVRAHRARLGNMKRVSPPAAAPSPAPPTPVSPESEPLPDVHPEEGVSMASEREQAIAAWAHETFGENPLAERVSLLADVDVPVDTLLAVLSAAVENESVRSLGYFTSAAGMTTLRQLESELRRKKPGRRSGRPTPLKKLLGGYEAAESSRASAV